MHSAPTCILYLALFPALCPAYCPAVILLWPAVPRLSMLLGPCSRFHPASSDTDVCTTHSMIMLCCHKGGYQAVHPNPVTLGSCGFTVPCRQIAAQASLIMLAGYETTAVALTQCIYLLTKHPAAQEKLLQEVDSATRQISYEDLERFPFAAAVLKETLRLQGPSAFFSRVAMKDTHVSCSKPGQQVVNRLAVNLRMWFMTSVVTGATQNHVCK